MLLKGVKGLTLKAMNLWYGLGAHAYTSTEFFSARTKNLILSYFTADQTNNRRQCNTVQR